MLRTHSDLSTVDGIDWKGRETELKEAQAYLRNIIQATSDFIIVLDYDGKIKTANEAAIHLLGYKREEDLLGRTAGALTKEEPLFFNPADFNRLMHEGSVRNVEVFFRGKGAKRIPMLLSGSVLKNDQGKLSGVVLVAKDITELKKVDQMKDEFISTVSHELRTPLTSMKGMVSNIAAGVTGAVAPKLGEYLQRMDANIDRLTHIVSNLLDISKFQSGEVPLQRKPVDLFDLIQDVVSLFQPQSEKGGITLVQKGLAHTSPLSIDEEKMRQVLNNLIGNALKFTPRGGRITVGLEESDSEVMMSVSDTGRGIPEEHQSHIFDRFYQALHEVGGGEKGVGLGLAIVEEIVKMHEGKMSVESEPGKGSRFTIHLPKKAKGL